MSENTTYALDLELVCRVIARRKVMRSLAGRTTRLGTRVVECHLERPLKSGQDVELVIMWPAMLDGLHPLALVIRGRVSRSAYGYAEISIRNHEFRLRPQGVSTAAEERPRRAMAVAAG